MKENKIQRITFTLNLDELDALATQELTTLLQKPGKTVLYITLKAPNKSFSVSLRSQTPGIAVTKELVDFAKETPGIKYKLN